MLLAVGRTGRTDDDPGGARIAAVDFDQLYRREYGRMVALAYALTGDRGVAEEAAQDAFLAAHRDWNRVGRYDAPGAWVRRVVLNRSRTRLRSRARESRALRRLVDATPTTIGPVERDDDAFWDAVRALPRRQAQCVALRYVDELDTEEIAAVLGCAVPTVRVHLHRARAALAVALHVEAGVDEDGTDAPLDEEAP